MKKELNSKDELIKSLIVYQDCNTRHNTEIQRYAVKGHLQVEPSPIFTPVQQENQSHHKNTTYDGNLNLNMSIKDTHDLFGLKSTAYFCTNCHH